MDAPPQAHASMVSNHSTTGSSSYHGRLCLRWSFTKKIKFWRINPRNEITKTLQSMVLMVAVVAWWGMMVVVSGGDTCDGGGVVWQRQWWCGRRKGRGRQSEKRRERENRNEDIHLEYKKLLPPSQNIVPIFLFSQ